MDTLLKKDQRMLITGAAGGIGGALVTRSLSLGALVVAVDANETRLKASAQAWEEQFGRGRFVPMACDIRQEEAVRELFTAALKELGSLDTIMNVAGITRDQTIRKLSFDDFQLVLSVNLCGPFLLSKLAAQYWAENRNNVSDAEKRAWSIVNTSSIMGLVGNFGQTNYCASKAGLIGLTQALALEGAKIPFRANAIAPGFTATEMANAIPADRLSIIRDSIPMGRLAEPEEIANAMVFLASPLASYITGHVLVADGGYTAR